jgi:peptide/nickel transport system ATP-binding protein
MSSAARALTVDGLDIAYRTRGRDLQVLHDLSFSVGPGEAYGLVGESGCGKSTVALAVMRYLPRNGRVSSGRIMIGEHDLFALGKEQIRRLRAMTISMVYQDPGKALNPSIRVGKQIAEIFRLRGLGKAESNDAAVGMLERVRIADGSSVFNRYPHQISGGMQQRVAIAMALSINPKLLILDEPTTGLDATVEAEILDLIAQLRSEFATSILFISHNLAVISQVCDRVGVLYAGALIEEGPTAEIFNKPRHPYTAGLIRCLPQQGRSKDLGPLESIPGSPPAPGDAIRGCTFAPRCWMVEDKCRTEPPPLYDLSNRFSRCHFHGRAQSEAARAPRDLPMMVNVDRGLMPMLRVMGVSKTFGTAHLPVRALHDVSLELWPGETLGLVGESGSGKTTLARLLLGLSAPDPGGILELDGVPLGGGIGGRHFSQLKSLQMVFQNPDSALNRAHSVSRLIGRVLVRLGRLPKLERTLRLSALTRAVRLDDHYLSLRPRELSGGLQQRVAIARAFAGEPRIVVCDEPTSALDVSVQATILNLLTGLQASQRVSYLFISHDLATVRYLSDRIAVLYLGRLMEVGSAERVFSGPHHPYTAALLAAVPTLGKEAHGRVRLKGEIPSAIHNPSGCVFHTRCPRKLGPICEQEEPPLNPGVDAGHRIRCHIPASDLPYVAVDKKTPPELR